MAEHRHLRIVKNTAETSEREGLFLRDRPLAWLALVAVSVISPALDAIGSTLQSYEAQSQDIVEAVHHGSQARQTQY